MDHIAFDVFPNPVFGGRTRTRSGNHQYRSERRGHCHPRRCGKGGANSREAGGVAIGTLAPGMSRWPARSMTPMEFILRFTFTNLDLDMTSSERSTPAHLQINLDILQRWPLPPDLYALSSNRKPI
jgi:hypothetical protein